VLVSIVSLWYDKKMFDIVTLVKTAGYLGIFAIVFAESGLLVGFFFPGDSLLFTAGILSAAGLFNIWLLAPLVFFAAVLGDNAGYFIGKKAGEKLFQKEDSFFFRKSHVEKTKKFFEDYGTKAIILARFVPVARTFAPTLAGVGQMHYRTFFLYNLIGGALWGFGLPLAGYFLGSAIPDVDRYLLPIILGIIFLSLLPMIKLWWGTRLAQ
jgi:membrane-associated protein